MKKQITIRYDIRKIPLLLISLGIIGALSLIYLLLFFVFSKSYVIYIALAITLSVITFICRDILLLEYNLLKWYEKAIFIREKQQDSQVLKNQVIILKIQKNMVQISFKKMGYFKESQIEEFGILLNDFVKGYEFAELEPDDTYYHINFKPLRERINLNEVDFSDLIFPVDTGYKYRIDSELEVSLGSTLILGASGKGKSWLVQNYYYPLLSQVGELYIIDIKNTTPKEWRKNFTKDIEEGIEFLKKAAEEMDKRYEQELLKEKPIFLVFEEVQAFKACLSKEQLEEYSKALKTILVKGRECRVFIIFITQFANIGQQNGVFSSSGERSQFSSARILLGVPSQEQSMQAFNVSRSELPPRTSGVIGSGYIQIDDVLYFIEFPTKK